MEYRRLGKSGLKVSALSFGSWVTFHNQVDTQLATRMLATCFDMGMNFFDNAEAYADGESETIMGAALQKLGWRRDSYVVSSKVFWGGKLPTQRGLSRKHVRDACHAAMKRLQVDYLDLYFCHRPDSETPIEETVWAMNDLIRQGHVLYWGTSEWSAQEIAEAYGIARQYNLLPPTMEQPQYNMLHRARVENEYAKLYETMGLGTTIWSPLASGVLTGKYSQGIPAGSRLNLPGYEFLREQLATPKGQRQLKAVQELNQVAKDLECSLAALAIAWCLKNPNVSTVILGASKVEQIQENSKALEVLPKLTASVMENIGSITLQAT